ncbi:YbaB/EbfC family nucleoid-associated protein [Actinokineospora cianjurensis]|uniref:YbaB/EbfC DNA-binding family protein n=1 Tax=Actinokineospora cianjurensis TaxID=585224 RepID=A0A421BA85_9PSEU|nr:YbaB/EbfC family nucleoid-associated protein [Actinokineospora cianjurensis]RLK61472.1 YbaB/EbfC DNA-binding family protein [Actinokineospora cianjurensis]
MQTPDEWLADFEAKVADLQQKATDFKQAVESSATTKTSTDGSIAVTVAPNGALTGLTLTDVALGTTGKALADQIMALVVTARQSAADSVAEAFTPLGGAADIVQHIEPPAEPTSEPRRRPVTDDEDFSESTPVYKDNDSW